MVNAEDLSISGSNLDTRDKYLILRDSFIEKTGVDLKSLSYLLSNIWSNHNNGSD